MNYATQVTFTSPRRKVNLERGASNLREICGCLLFPGRTPSVRITFKFDRGMAIKEGKNKKNAYHKTTKKCALPAVGSGGCVEQSQYPPGSGNAKHPRLKSHVGLSEGLLHSGPTVVTIFVQAV